MPLITAADLDFALQDIGTPGTMGATTVFGKFDPQREIATVSEGIATTAHAPTWLVRSGSLPGLAIDATIAIDGHNYLVRDFGPDPRSSEALTLIILVRVE